MTVGRMNATEVQGGSYITFLIRVVLTPCLKHREHSGEPSIIYKRPIYRCMPPFESTGPAGADRRERADRQLHARTLQQLVRSTQETIW